MNIFSIYIKYFQNRSSEKKINILIVQTDFCLRCERIERKALIQNVINFLKQTFVSYINAESLTFSVRRLTSVRSVLTDIDHSDMRDACQKDLLSFIVIYSDLQYFTDLISNHSHISVLKLCSEQVNLYRDRLKDTELILCLQKYEECYSADSNLDSM